MSHVAQKVRLLVDLTKYDPKLVVGVEGVTVGEYGMWSRNYARFVGVDFGFGTFDILWTGLEIIETKKKSHKRINKE